MTDACFVLPRYTVCYPIGVIPVDTLTDLYSLNFVVLFSVLKDFILNV